MAPSRRNRLTANGELALVRDIRHRRARVVSGSVVRSYPERDAWLSVDACGVLGDISEHAGRPKERCSNVSKGEVAQSPNWRIAGPRLLSRQTAAALKGDYRFEPVDGFDLRSNPHGAYRLGQPFSAWCSRIACRVRGCDGSDPRALRGRGGSGDQSPPER